MDQRLYIMDTDALWDDDLFQSVYACLTKARQDKADRCALRADRNLSLGAGLLLEYALRLCGLKKREWQYGAGEHQKPFLMDHPDLHFNCSHSGHLVLCALSEREVGCDIQQITERKAPLAERCLAPREIAALASSSTSAERETLFFRLWAIKESYMKYTGLGLFLRPDRFEVCLDSPRVSVLCGDSAEPVYITEYRTAPDYACAVCSSSDFDNTPLTEVTVSEALSMLTDADYDR